MGRLSKLNAMAVQKLNKRGLHGDGGGLYLQITKAGNKSWIFRYMLNHKSHHMGLGSAATVSLAEARAKAEDYRRLLASGMDPLQERMSAARMHEQQMARLKPFDQCVDLYLESREGTWSNLKHRNQWRNTLDTYALPIVGNATAQDVDIEMVVRILDPIWLTKTETANRVRGRVEAVLDFARVRGWRSGENPARWRGNLDKILPAPNKIKNVKHHAALPMSEVADFAAALKKRNGISAKALEIQLLTVLRPGEVVGAKWGEFDFAEGIWTVPAERMKKKRPHRVPLSRRALEILSGLNRVGDYAFPGQNGRSHITTDAMLILVKEIRRDLNVTTHGFRSTFRDWAAERTSFPREVIEACLAHKIKDQTEAAYLRSDILQKRKRLMEKWAEFCIQKPTFSSISAIGVVGRL